MLKLLTKIFKYWRRIFGNCSRIPQNVSDDEIVLRTIFTDANFNNKGELKSNFMRPQITCKDEDNASIRSNKLSVTRFKYCDIEFCRKHAHAHSSLPHRSYWGFARYFVSDLRKPIVINKEIYMCEVKNSPTKDNPAHANVVLPFEEPYQEGKPASPIFNKFLDSLCDSLKSLCKPFEDPNPKNDKWTGKEIDDR